MEILVWGIIFILFYNYVWSLEAALPEAGKWRNSPVFNPEKTVCSRKLQHNMLAKTIHLQVTLALNFILMLEKACNIKCKEDALHTISAH